MLLKYKYLILTDYVLEGATSSTCTANARDSTASFIPRPPTCHCMYQYFWNLTQISIKKLSWVNFYSSYTENLKIVCRINSITIYKDC